MNMKKLLIAALMFCSTSMAFAGNSDALKAILKASDYAQAEQLLKQNFSQLANDAERAAAYNKLTELAMKEYNAQATVDMENQTLAQLGQKDKMKAYDTVAFNRAALNALKAAVECDKYDMMPNEKGKVKPRFHDKNAKTIWNVRKQLVNAGQSAAENRKTDDVLKYWGTFLDTDQAPLFKGMNYEEQKPYFGQVALFTSQYAYQAKNLDLANKYVDLALGDTAVAKDAMNLKVVFMQEGLKTKDDTLKCIEKLQGLYQKYPDNALVFNSLVSMYNNARMNTQLDQLVADKLASNPKFFPALRAKGYVAMNAQKYDDAINGFKAALEVKPNDALTLTYIGYCINAKAAKVKTLKEQVELLKQSVPYLEKARSVDPNRQEANWSYSLYQCYYGIYGADDSRTKELEAMVK